MPMSWSEWRERELPLLNDSGGDLFCDLLPIGGGKSQLSFGWIGQKAAFDENGWQPAIAKHVIFGRADPTVFGANAINDLPLYARGEHCTAIVFGISLNAIRATAWRGIVMDANEDRIPLCISDRASCRQRNKNICGARHYRAQSRALQNFLQTQCRIECHHFFRHSLARNSASIKTAMTWIDDDGRERIYRLGGARSQAFGRAKKQKKNNLAKEVHAAA